MGEEVSGGKFHEVAEGVGEDGREDGAGLDEEVGCEEAENRSIARLDNGVDVNDLDVDLLAGKLECDDSSRVVEDVVHVGGSKKERSDENRSRGAETGMEHDRDHAHAEGNLFHDGRERDVAEGEPVDLGLCDEFFFGRQICVK